MQATKRNKKLTYALLIAAIIAVMGLVGISVVGAQDGGGRLFFCPCVPNFIWPDPGRSP